MITENLSAMIVENQPMMRTALSMALLTEGMTVLAEVADSRDALWTASQLTPNLILFSVNEFEARDYERIAALRQELPKSLIVALITGEVHGQFQLALEHGAHLVLTKSTPRSELLHSIKEMAKKRIYPASVQVN